MIYFCRVLEFAKTGNFRSSEKDFDETLFCTSLQLTIFKIFFWNMMKKAINYFQSSKQSEKSLGMFAWDFSIFHMQLYSAATQPGPLGGKLTNHNAN